MVNKSELQAWKDVLMYDRDTSTIYSDYFNTSEALESGIGIFIASNQTLEEFILELDNAQQWNTGGGCMVSVLPLDNGELFITTDEAGGIFKDEDDFYAHEGEPLKHEWVYV